MKALGFRQSNAWLHTWTGLLLGWLLYLIFLTGTLSFFRDEIDFWMQPELHGSQADAGTTERVVAKLNTLAPDAALWNITLPSERNGAVDVQWFARGERIGKGGGERLALDAATAEPLTPRETAGGNFLYRLHFELYGMPRLVARWIVGIATLVMLVALISGVITHKKIFKDFFTFRPRKGQRSWLDAHNALAVLSLPFHLVITYSGLLLLPLFLLMPWGIDSAYQGNTQQYYADAGYRRSQATQSEATPAAPLVDIAPLLAEAGQRWSRPVGQVRISDPNTAGAVIELREQGGDSLIDRGNAHRLRFDGASGALLEGPAEIAVNGTSAVYNVLTSLHLLRFAGPALRWLFFLSGLLGTAMIATGLVLWVVKRLPERQKIGRTPYGHRLVEVLNVGTLAGLPLAIGAYFWANRLLPVALPQRVDWEITVFFVSWLLCLLHPLLRTHKRAWIEQLAGTAGLFASLWLFDMTLPSSGLWTAIRMGDGLLIGCSLSLLAFALLFAVAAWRVRCHVPKARAPRVSAGTKAREVTA